MRHSASVVYQSFVSVNPIALLTTAVHDLMAGEASATDIAWVLLICAVLVIVFAPLTMRMCHNQK